MQEEQQEDTTTTATTIPQNPVKRVPKACAACSKRHTRCSMERPCARCVKLGIECMEATIETRKRRSKYEKLKYLKFQRSSKRKGTKKDSDSYEETTSSASSTEDEKENEQDAPIETPSNIATVFSIDTLHLYDMITAVAYCVQYIFPEDCSFGIVICDPLHTIRFISDSLLKELMHESVHTVVSMSDILVPKYLQQVFVPDVAALVETKQTMSTLGIDDLYHEHVGRLVVKSKAGHVYELSHKRIVRFNENRLLDGVYMYVYL